MNSEPFPQTVVRFANGLAQETNVPGGRPMVFIHIPKTAGTSFTQYLRSHFRGPHEIAPPYFGDFRNIGLDNPGHRLFWGHFTYAQFSQQRTDVSFIAFLRDPLQRIVSQYKSYHNTANASGGWWQVLDDEARRSLKFAQQATFEEFVLSDAPFIVHPLDNLQTHFLSSHRSPDHPEFLSSARENLASRMLFFGVTESFQRSIELFRFQFRSTRPYCEEAHTCNVSSPYPIQMTDRVRERLDRLVRFDRPLYEYACSLFEQRCATLRATGRQGRKDAAA
jgi:hypothetical protein